MEDGKVAHVSRVQVTDSASRGVHAEMGTTLDGSDLTVLRSGGQGVAVSLSSTIDLSRVRVEDAVAQGVLLDSTTGSLADVTVRRVEAGMDASDGLAEGIGLHSGFNVVLERALIEHPTFIGLGTQGGGTHLAGSDVVVRDVEPDPATGDGRGLDVGIDTRAEVSRLLVERHRNVGIAIEGATATLDDVTVRDGLGNAHTGMAGRGITVQGGGHLAAARLLLERNPELGLAVLDGSIAHVTDLVVRDSKSLPDGTLGQAVEAAQGGQITVERALLERNHEISACAYDPGSALLMNDVVIRHTLQRDCSRAGSAQAACDAGAAGIGAGAYAKADMSITHFLLTGNALIGAQVADATLSLSDGTISDNPVGINVQLEHPDYDSLVHDVRFVDNGQVLDGDALPVPSSAF